MPIRHKHPGWPVTTSTDIGISLPPKYIVSDFASQPTDALLETIRRQHPDNPGLVETVRKIASNGLIKIFAVEETPDKSGFRDNFNLIVSGLPSGANLDTLVSQTKAQLASMTVPGTLKIENRTLPSGDAARITGEFVATTGNYGVTTYIMVHGGKQYVFSFSNGKATEAAGAKLADLVMDTVYFAS